MKGFQLKINKLNIGMKRFYLNKYNIVYKYNNI